MKKKLTKEEIKCHKMTGREKFGKLSNNEIDNLCNKSEVKKKRSIKAIDGFRKKLFIPDHEISVSIEHKVKPKIGTIFVNEDILEEYSVKIYKIDLYFSENYEKKKYELIKMVNNIYCLELIFILLNVV